MSNRTEKQVGITAAGSFKNGQLCARRSLIREGSLTTQRSASPGTSGSDERLQVGEQQQRGGGARRVGEARPQRRSRAALALTLRTGKRGRGADVGLGAGIARSGFGAESA